MRAPLLAAAAVAAATVAVHVRDPHETGSWGLCPSRYLFGVWCPFCGGLRAVNDLTNLHVSAAFSSNVLVMAAMPFVVALWARRVVVQWRGETAPLEVPAWAVWVTVAVLVVFTVLRNLPGSWLAP